MSSSKTAPSGNGNNNNDDSNDNKDTTSPPPPPSKSSSPPPPASNGNSSSPPPPSNDNNSSSPPPPSNDNNSSSPPPPSNDNSSSPPPPSNGNSSSPPPPQKDDGKSSSPPPKDNDKSSPPPPKTGDDSSPSPPKNDDNSSKGSSQSPSFQFDQNDYPSPTPPSSSSSGNSRTRAIAPPGEKGESKDSDSRDSMPGGMSPQQMGIVVGITAGVVALLIFMILIVVCCCKKKKRRPEIHYYMNSAPNGSGSGYYNSGQHPNWHAINMQPNSAMSGPMSGGWMHPPPPPPMMPSGEMSANYSGPRGPVLPPPAPNFGFGAQSTFTYEELVAATDNFSQANLLGQGGFGYVHKGKLPNGTVVAVKSLKSGSGQGEREFQAEVEIISRVHHRHLVSLVGYSIAGDRRMLIYEFVPNNTLEYHLHGKGVPVMDWTKRMRIALGSAKGLAYLHEDCHPRIIHRDIKTANILIDDNFEAMVADFGLAKLSDVNATHVSTRVMGTFGYLAPEYASSGKLSEKSDVFSFGVMLLELITGKRPVDNTDQYMEDSLVDWARPILTRAMGDGNYEELIDPRLGDNYEPDEMARMVACAAASVRHSARRRAKMSQIVRALEGALSLDDLNEARTKGSQPSSNGSTEYDTAQYNADMKKFRNVLNSQEYSSESSAQTSKSDGSNNRSG